MIGVICAMIGNLGVDEREGTADIPRRINTMAYSISVILNVIAVIVMNESHIDVNRLKDIPLIISRYGNAFYATHGLLIFSAFLNEAYELDDILTFGVEEEHIDNIWYTLEFCCFFWRIEFHLACIERLKWVNQNYYIIYF